MPSYTYGQIQTRIADELHRTDLTAQIKLAIVSAVEHYERERFWFTESITTSVTTTIGQNYIAMPSDMVNIDKIQITVGTSKYNLTRIGYDEWADKASTSTTSGQPTEYSVYQDRIYLFPTPGSAYTVTLSYVDRLTTLSGSSDANGWTNYAEELIRQRAKADILINQLRYPPAIQEAGAFGARGEQFLSGIEKGAYQNLRMESDDRVGTGRVKVRYL
jgi:hypothetical protein